MQNNTRRDAEYLFFFSSNAGKYEPEKLRIWTLFTQRILKLQNHQTLAMRYILVNKLMQLLGND